MCKLWQSKIQWDQKINESYVKDWKILSEDMLKLSQLEFPRFVVNINKRRVYFL